MTRIHFRFLLIASVVVGLVGGFVDLVVPSLISDAFHAAEKAQVDSMSLAHLIAFLAPSVVGALLYFASLYGLYRFRSWAPRMAVVGTALILIGSSVTGTSAQSGVAASLSYLASYLWGAVLVLSYVPSFKNQFLRSADSLERPAK